MRRKQTISGDELLNFLEQQAKKYTRESEAREAISTIYFEVCRAFSTGKPVGVPNATT